MMNCFQILALFFKTCIFDDTIKNNIKFGNPNATDEEMIDIAKKAQCHDFIMKLPQAYETVLQEGVQIYRVVSVNEFLLQEPC